MELSEKLPQEVVSLLKEKHFTISAAESCTGGLFVKLITDVSGASSVLNESYVTYSPKSKIRILGVLRETIERNTVVSMEVAKEMAEGVKKVALSDVGVAFTGYAGPDGEDVGLVYMGIAYGDNCRGYELRLSGTRDEIRLSACLNGFLEIKKIIEGL